MADAQNDVLNGSRDLKTIENFANLPAGSEVYPRLLPSTNIGTLAGARDAIFEAGGLPAKPFPTLATMQTDGVSLADGQLAIVYDETANNGLYEKKTGVWAKSNYDPLLNAKEYVDSYATVKSKTIPDGTDFNSLTEAGVYRVISNASALTMLNCPSTRAGVLEVLAISALNTAQRFTPYGIEKTIYTRASDANVFPLIWDELLLKSSADATYATQSALGNASSAAISAVTQSDYYGKKYSKSEVEGSAFYSNGFYVGYNSVYDKAVTFNAINARVSNATSGDVEYRIYTGGQVTTGANGYQVVGQPSIAAPTFSGFCASFPKSDNGSAQNIILDKAVTIPASTPFVIIFKAVDFTKFSIAYAPAVTGNLESRSYNLSQTAGDWSSQASFGNASIELGYVQAGFKLLVVIPQSGGGGDVELYRPSIVMPPKIYALANLQAHIYPEHLLPEPSDLYLHDVTCLRGKQTTRGWVYDVPTSQAAGQIALSWSVADKQTGATLSSASSLVIIADQNKAGAKSVLVVGDSYVNGAIITQRLLDISTTDPLKLSLVGTRGTGLNKHEGRGGWKVEDYATAGRTYYRFTVSSVTAIPAINSAIYSYGGGNFTVQETNISGGSGTLICSHTGTAPVVGSSGVLTKVNSSAGDATITFTDVQSVSGNPFWFSGAVNFGQYITTNSLATPDVVLIQLGVNDSFNAVNDTEVVTMTETAFAQLDTLIASIKAKNPLVKIGLVAPNTYANQDAFGANYGCNQTAWRAKRNIVIWNHELYARFKDKEAQNIYVVAAGVNVDTQANFPTTTQAINSHNATVITTQNNGVHPAESGYKQIGDAMFAWIKAVI